MLVRGYLEVDPGLLHRMVNERLGDFELFAESVEAHLARTGG